MVNEVHLINTLNNPVISVDLTIYHNMKNVNDSICVIFVSFNFFKGTVENTGVVMQSLERRFHHSVFYKIFFFHKLLSTKRDCFNHTSPLGFSLLIFAWDNFFQESPII